MLWFALFVAEAKKPKYVEEKVFIPGETPEFSVCLARVTRAQETCRDEAQKTANACKVTAALEKTNCQIRGGPNALCIERACLVDESSCTTLLETGFEACGGKIEVKMTCVKNCTP